MDRGLRSRLHGAAGVCHAPRGGASNKTRTSRKVMSPSFLVLEGIDGSGTTSQMAALASQLRDRGHTVLTTAEPSGGSVGRLARSQLSVRASDPVDPAVLALLFAADRLDHLTREIEPALGAGQLVLCDRYLMSSYAYQSLDCPPDWVESINRRARQPDLNLFLQVDPAVAMGRVAARRGEGVETERFDVPALQRRLAEAYAQIAAQDRAGPTVTVDGGPDMPTVTAALLQVCVAAGL